MQDWLRFFKSHHRAPTPVEIGFVFSSHRQFRPFRREIGFVFSTHGHSDHPPGEWVRFFKSVSQNPRTPQFGFDSQNPTLK
jgi:hypothetical protein